MKLALTIPGIGKIDSGLPTGVPTGGLDTGNKIIGVLIESALIAALGFALFVIAHAAFNIMTSQGDKEKLHQGRNRLNFAIIGLLVIFSSFFIINFLGSSFGIELIKSTPSTSCIGIFCNSTCYSQDYINKNYPAPLCGAECTTKGGVTGLYGKVCLDTLEGCAGPGRPCDAFPCCSSQGLVCDNNTSLCVTPTLGPINPPAPPPDLIATPIPNTTPASGPTPAPTFLMPGAEKTCTFLVNNNSGLPQQRAIDLVFNGGDPTNVKVEVRAPALSQTVFQEGAGISFPQGSSNNLVMARMIVRPGASPTCFDNIACNLISTGLTLETQPIGQNVCILSGLNTFFANHRLVDKNTVLSDITLFNSAPIEQKASFAIDNNQCFPASPREFWINNSRTSPGTPHAIPPGGALTITMRSTIPTVPTGTTPTFNCSITVVRVLE